MTQIILVEDNTIIGDVVKKTIVAKLDFEVYWLKTYHEAARLIQNAKAKFFMGIFDLNLPDAPNGEIVDLAQEHGIPCLIFTGEFDNHIREKIWSKNVIDYVFKDEPDSVEYLTSLVSRIYKNQQVKVLVVDDSATVRTHIGQLLRTHHYNVFEATNGIEAIEILYGHSDIKMSITDYHMPRMDGIKLTKFIRQKYHKEDMAIVGISDQKDKNLSARFLKSGANDFIEKPFTSEEFYCRITQNIDMIEYIEKVRNLSNRDFLTGLYNRRYLFESGKKATRGSGHLTAGLTVAMIDIDNFKDINDSFGHDAGDLVLKEIAKSVDARFKKPDIVSRFGGEEFCILTSKMTKETASTLFNEIRQNIGALKIKIGLKTIHVTVSIGVCCQQSIGLEEMIKNADLMLYKAKATGKNRVFSC